jgi:hypothetical protein
MCSATCAPRNTPKAMVAALALALILLLAACGASPGRLLIEDEGGTLDRARVEIAAAPLLERGATVAVFIAGRSAAPEADLVRRLDAAAMLSGGEIIPSGIAVYASIEPRYSELRAGSRWSRRLPDAALGEVRLARLNPALQANELTNGVASTLAAIDARASTPALAERIGRALLVVFLAAGTVAVIGRSPLGPWLGKRWRGSAPEQLLQSLWGRTPWGRARLLRILKIVLLRVEDRAEFARSWCQKASSTNRRDVGGPLMARLRALDHERARLQKAPADHTQLAGLEQLANDYTSLGWDAERVCPKPPARQARAGAAAGAAAVAGAAASQSDSSPGDSPSDWGNLGASETSGPSRDGGDW